jgi:hypothetical protein
MHVDEFIDELLHSERVCDIILPRLQVRDRGLFQGHIYPPRRANIQAYLPIETLKPWIL